MWPESVFGGVVLDRTARKEAVFVQILTFYPLALAHVQPDHWPHLLMRLSSDRRLHINTPHAVILDAEQYTAHTWHTAPGAHVSWPRLGRTRWWADELGSVNWAAVWGLTETLSMVLNTVLALFYTHAHTHTWLLMSVFHDCVYPCFLVVFVLCCTGDSVMNQFY